MSNTLPVGGRKKRDPLHVTTAESYLKRLGFYCHQYKKGLYFDGHERDDVVKDRNEYLPDKVICIEFIL